MLPFAQGSSGSLLPSEIRGACSALLEWDDGDQAWMGRRPRAQPQTLYQGLVNFTLHWPNRSKALRGPRALVETAFSCLKTRFGHRLGCRKKRGRTNELLPKTIAHNVSVLTARAFISQAE